ncbi:MAG: hypothetical protein RIS28_216 [Bacteroidota bacterium]
MRGGDGPMRGNDGGPRANNRGGIRITASGQCVQLQFEDKNLNAAGAAGAIISLWIPNDTASIGKTVSIFNGKLSSADEQAFRPIKRRYEDGEVYLPNKISCFCVLQ